MRYKVTKLGRYMSENGVSIYRLSKETGLDKRTISALVNGKRDGNMWTWLEIANALGCRLDDIAEK